MRESPAVSSAGSAGSTYDTYDYWLMPHGLRGLMTTVFWSPAAEPAGPSPGRVRPFQILAPGKLGRERAEHAFWRGALWGRTVALQGDSTFTKYDLFEVADAQLHYWGTFRGNGFYDSEESHSFSSPFAWMDRWMAVGDFKQQRITDSVFDPRSRRLSNTAEQTLRVEIVAHHDAWRDPDSGALYTDVLEVSYWGRHPDPVSKEVYHLGRGLGTIRFETKNPLEPSGVRYQYADSFERFRPPDLPTLPWVDPFKNATYVRNGFFEDFKISPVEGGAVTTYLRGWSGSRDAVITADLGDEGAGPWKIVLRGSSGGGDSAADFVVPSDWIPVTPGVRYRLSGGVWRSAKADNVYLDFDDGAGQGASFEDAQALATSTGMWERVAAEATVGASTTAIRVRCVRDGANEGHAYYDAITLQRVG
jgi:hypothetical protein